MLKPLDRFSRRIANEVTVFISRYLKGLTIHASPLKRIVISRPNMRRMMLLPLLLISTLSLSQADEKVALPDKSAANKEQHVNSSDMTIGPEINAYDQAKVFESFNPQSFRHEYGIFGTEIMKSRPGDGTAEAQFLAMILIDDDLKRSWKKKNETVDTLHQLKPKSIERVESLLMTYKDDIAKGKPSKVFIKKARGLIHMLSMDNANALRSIQFSQIEALRRQEYKTISNIKISPERKGIYQLAATIHDKAAMDPRSDMGKIYQKIRNNNPLRNEFVDLNESRFQSSYLVPESGGRKFDISLAAINQMLLNIFHRHYLSEDLLKRARDNYQGSPDYYKILNDIGFEYYAFLHDIGYACEKDLEGAMNRLYTSRPDEINSKKGNMALSLVQTLSVALRLQNTDNDENWGEHKGYEIPLDEVWTGLTVVTPDYLIEQISKKDESLDPRMLESYRKMRKKVPEYIRYIASCIRKAHTSFQLITDREKSPEDFQQELDFYIMDYDDYIHREAYRYGQRRHRKLKDASN